MSGDSAAGQQDLASELSAGAADPEKQQAAADDVQEMAEAIADAHDPGNLDGLLEMLISEADRRTRTLQAAALESAYRALGSAAGQTQIGNQVFNLYGAGHSEHPERTCRPIAGAMLDRVRETFVAPSGYPRLWRRIADRPLLVLRAPAGTGRTYSALHLLDAVCAGRVRRYEDPVQVSHLAAGDFAEGTGYLVEDLPEKFVRATQPDRLEELNEKLAARHARMVITTTADFASWCPEFADYVGELDAPPVLAEVLDRHLLTDLDAGYHGRARALLADPEVTTVLAGMATDGCAISAVREFAGLLKRVVQGELTLAGACTAVDRSAARFASWFQELSQPEDRAFAIALGVLHGLPYPTIAAASGTLWAHIQRVERPHKPPRARVFARTTEELLDAARAKIVDDSEDTGYGFVPVRTARSVLDSYPERLLRLLRDDYPAVQPTLMGWLRKLATDPDPRVRAQAAAAAGMIATADFNRTHEQMLAPWAGSWRPADRQAAVAALGTPAFDPAYTAVVWNLIEDWLDESRPLPLQMTAVASLGASVGRADYPRALRLLGTRVDTGNYRLKQTICQAVTDLFAAPTGELAGLVLDTVGHWARQRHLHTLRTALGCFVQIALDREWAAPDGGERWPLLLRLIELDTGRRQAAACLWRQALNRPRFDGAAIKVLHQWVRAGERRPYLREPLQALVATVPGSVRDQRTLRHYLRVWATGDDPLPVTARLLLDALPPGEVTSHEAA